MLLLFRRFHAAGPSCAAAITTYVARCAAREESAFPRMLGLGAHTVSQGAMTLSELATALGLYHFHAF